MSYAQAVAFRRILIKVVDLSSHIAGLEQIEEICLGMLQTQTAGVRIFDATLEMQSFRTNLDSIRQQIYDTALEHKALIQIIRQIDINRAAMHSHAVSNKMVERLEQLRREESAYLANTDALRVGNQPNLQNTSNLIKKVIDYFENEPYKYF